MSKMIPDLQKFRGQWGGKTETGEEMWWTEPNPRLFKGSKLARLRFFFDTRQYFLLTYLRAILTGRDSPMIVDFGCGTGGLTLSMSKVLGLPIHGYDIFATQIQIANAHALRFKDESRFSLLANDGKIPLPDASVDAIFSADVLGHVPSIPDTLNEWSRVIKPGGGISLFTESNYSPDDRSLMARLARKGMDMCDSVPEHISLFPRETLEVMFREAGFEVLDRRSATVGHWFFFPKDYVLLFKKFSYRGPLAWASWIWNRVSRVLPAYPMPQEMLRLALTICFGRNAYGTGYFYRLRKVSV